MRIDISDRHDVRVLHCTGDLTLGDSETELVAACDDALEAGVRRIVLDFVPLRWMDSAGVGAVVACSKRVAERGGVIKIALRSDGAIGRIFEAVCLDRVFDLFADSDAAVASFAR